MKWLKIGAICLLVVGVCYVGVLGYQATKAHHEDMKYATVKEAVGTITGKKHEDSRRESYMGMDINGKMKHKTRYVSEKNYVYVNWREGDRTINNEEFYHKVEVGDKVTVVYKVGANTGKIYYVETKQGEPNEPYLTY